MDIQSDNAPQLARTLVTGTTVFPATEAVPVPVVEKAGRRHGVVVSLLVHLSLLGTLCAFGQSMEARPLVPEVYEVSLAGLPTGRVGGSAGAGGTAAAASSEAPAETAAHSPAVPSATTSSQPAPKPEVPVSGAKPTPAPRQQKSKASPPTPRKARPPSPAPADPLQRVASSATSLSAPQASSASSPSWAQAESAKGGANTGENSGASRQSFKGEAGGQGGEGEVFSVHQVDRMPAILRRATPVYPPEAKKQRVEGRVVVRLVVDATGKATQCSVQSAEPQGYFEAAALEAVGRMRFAPGKKAGQAVSTFVLLPFDFRLR